MSMLFIVMPAVAALLIAFALTPLTRDLAIRVGAVDMPAARKVHDTPIPRLGGLAVVFSIVIVEAILSVVMPPGAHLIPAGLLKATAIGALPIAVVSFIDDIRSLRALPKLIIHLAGAATTVALGVRLGDDIHLFGWQLHIGWMAMPISVLWLAGMANAFNFIDGLDGLSAGLALISSLSLAGVSIVTAHYEAAATALTLAGAVAGFLPFNVHPARVYLGDTGATSIGFFLGALTLRGGATATAGLAVVLPLVVVGVPLADAAVSILRRVVRRIEGAGNSIMEADRNHIHHRLLALGYTHERAVRLLCGIGLAGAVLAFASVYVSQQNAALLLTAMLIAAVIGIIKLNYDEFGLIRSGAALRLYSSVLHRGFFVVFADFAIVATAIYATIVLKYDDWNVHDHRALAINLLVIAPATTLIAFGTLGIYRRSWSKADLDDILRLVFAVVVSCSLATIILRLLKESQAPLTFFALYTFVSAGFMNAARASYRVLVHWSRRSNQHGEPVLIYGAGKGGMLALREISTNSDVEMLPIGFIDDNPEMRGRYVNGYPVLGDLSSLDRVVADSGARGVIVSSQKIPVKNVRAARSVCARNGAWLSIFEVTFRSPLASPPAAVPHHDVSRMWQ